MPPPKLFIDIKNGQQEDKKEGRQEEVKTK